MKAKSMLTKSLGCLLLLLTSASFTPTARATDSDANSADPNDAVTVTASLLRDSYALGQAVPLEILVTNHGEEPVYTYVDESGYLNLSVLLEDINGNRIPTGPVPEPPPPPRHWWITVDGKQIFTVPVVEIASGQTIKLTIQDALGLYHDRLQPGIYYLIPSDLTVIHEVGSIITRQDQEHKLWIEPSAVISKARYEINNVEITLHKEKIIYVDDDAVGNNDGTSWDNAYTSIQDALTDADAADKPIEVHVAKGVYKPYQGAESSSIAFRLINGVTLSGGYAGLKEQDPNIRDVEKYRTILSGDLNGDDIDVNNPSDLPSELTRSENFAGIVIGSGTDRTAVLDGFIIAGGYGGAPLIETLSGGAGMMNESGSPTINNCTFAVNSAAIGGGMMNRNDSNPILTNCKFIKNNARIGGAVYNLNSNPTFINCIFTNNYADDGAGMSISCSETTHALSFELIDCTFENNNTKNTGGGLIIYSCDLVLTNCFFIGNSASQGGGIYSGSGNPQLTNCQFISNSASEGGGMYNDSGIPNLINCQFIKNNALVTGGGLDSNDEANTLLIHCTFIDNSSNKSGGGIAGSNSIYNCIMSGNTAVNDGGAIYGWGEVGKCTVLGNKASGNGGGICTQGIITLNNSIFNNNYALHGDEIYIGLRYKHITGVPPTTIIVNSVATMRYNNIQGGEENISIENNCTLAWESGNTDEDPLFVNPGYWADADDPNIVVEPNDPNAVWMEGDYHLKSQAGRWDPASESWTVDDVTSPCIDAGDPNSPIGYEPFPNGGIINMGAYGGTPQASLSPLIGQASNPNPPDGAIGVSPNVILSWSPGEDAVAHDVYFGFTPSLGFVCNQIETDFNPGQLYSQGMLPSQAECFWRIDEIDSHGNIIPGETWRFKVQEYKGRLCFTGQTPVWINDSFTPISKVGIGQSIDGINRIEEVREHEGTFTLYGILLESGNCITVAENHIFMTEAGNWLSLHKLKAGTRLKTLNGSIKIQSVTKQVSPFTGKVYNLKIQGSDRYMVGRDMVIVRDY